MRKRLAKNQILLIIGLVIFFVIGIILGNVINSSSDLNIQLGPKQIERGLQSSSSGVTVKSESNTQTSVSSPPNIQTRGSGGGFGGTTMLSVEHLCEPHCGDGVWHCGEDQICGNEDDEELCDDGKHCADGTQCVGFFDCVGLGLEDEDCKTRNDFGNDCPATCGLECGNGVQDCGEDGECGTYDDPEECDDGLHCEDGTVCTDDPTICDGIGDGSCEARSGDGCSDQCIIECGNGNIDCGLDGICGNGDDLEECDDGRQCTDGTDCTFDRSVCEGIGDGSCEPRSGDLCSATCQDECYPWQDQCGEVDPLLCCDSSENEHCRDNAEPAECIICDDDEVWDPVLQECVPGPACCFEETGSCLDEILAAECIASGGTPGGVGLACSDIECGSDAICAGPNCGLCPASHQALVPLVVNYDGPLADCIETSYSVSQPVTILKESGSDLCDYEESQDPNVFENVHSLCKPIYCIANPPSGNYEHYLNGRLEISHIFLDGICSVNNIMFVDANVRLYDKFDTNCEGGVAINPIDITYTKPDMNACGAGVYAISSHTNPPNMEVISPLAFVS